MPKPFEKTEALQDVEADRDTATPLVPGEISDGTIGSIDEAQQRAVNRPPHGQNPALDPNPPNWLEATPNERVRNGLPRYATPEEKDAAQSSES